MQDDLYAGWHLLFDAFVEPEQTERLGDTEFLERLFRDLVDLLDMEILVEPAFKEVPCDPSKLDTDHDEGGVTGTVVVTTSHVSIHTWPLRRRFCLDVFSCKQFDHLQVEALVKERLGVEKRASRWIPRTWP